MYTTDIQKDGTVSATDAERLPPGGFSLRHGFPEWFGRKSRTAEAPTSKVSSPKSDASSSYTSTTKRSIAVYDVLKYIKSTFDEDKVLDDIPLAAAGNPGAWHAWRTHRRKLGKIREAPEESGETQAAEAAAAETSSVKQPGEWNWEGVWEDRVKKGIASSLSEPVLYGGSTATEELVSRYEITAEACTRLISISQDPFSPAGGR